MDDAIACRLQGRQLADQLAGWADLAPLIRDRQAAAGRLTLVFEPEAGDRLQELVAVERSCCSWAQWTLTGSRLDVTGPADAVAALATALLG